VFNLPFGPTRTEETLMLMNSTFQELLNDQKVRELLKANLQGDEDGEVSDQPVSGKSKVFH